jgi:23S rRNA pseudouridine1911/1915/1917 synthase
MFSNQKIEKTYFAIVQNKYEMKSRGTINIPIFDKEKKLEAKTNYKLEKKISNSLSYVRLNPKTGRKHQLRIHCSESNFPILGDKKYFHRDVQSKLREKKLFLHAGEIEFIGPNKKLVKYSADLPGHFEKYLEKIS